MKDLMDGNTCEENKPKTCTMVRPSYHVLLGGAWRGHSVTFRLKACPHDQAVPSNTGERSARWWAYRLSPRCP